MFVTKIQFTVYLLFEFASQLSLSAKFWNFAKMISILIQVDLTTADHSVITHSWTESSADSWIKAIS